MLYVVFAVFIPSGIPNFALYLLIGIVFWRFFSAASINGMQSLVFNADLIKNTYIPRELLVISAIGAITVGSLIELLLVMVFSFATLSVTLLGLFFALMVFSFELMLIVGFSCILAPLFVLHRDLSHIWDVILNAGFFLLPIIYSISTIPQRFLNIYLLNPLARFLLLLRAPLYNGIIPAFDEVVIAFFISVSFLFLAIRIFRMYESNLAEYL